MGYELWTSPVTGYRRRGTRLTDLHTTLRSQIRAKAIYEPLRSCRVGDPAVEMYDLLKRRDFDVAGVKAENETLIGYVRRIDLTGGKVSDHCINLSEDIQIQEDLELPGIMGRLKDHDFVFVNVGRDNEGIITRADLNKPLVRVYLFGLISLMEMHLTYWVRAMYPDDSWKASLTPERLQMAENVQAKRRLKKQNLELVGCLQFCDKSRLVLRCDNTRNNLQLGSRGKGGSKLKHVEDLRDTLAHSQYDLVGGRSWKHLIENVEWMENVITISDKYVEERAREMAKHDDVVALNFV